MGALAWPVSWALSLVPSSWPGWLVGLAVTADVLFRLMAIAVVSVNRRPSSAVGWVLAIFLIPYLGLLAFIVIGSPKLPRWRRERQNRIDELILERTSGRGVDPGDVEPAWLGSVSRLNRQLGAMPVVGGTGVRLISDYEGALAAMAEAIDGATRFVHLECYIVARDATTEPVFAALARAVERGVVVRVLLDHLASLRTRGYRATTRHLTEIGVAWRRALPVWPRTRELLRPDLRNHRKVLVVDGRVALTGSQNLVDAGYDKRANARRGLRWVDLVARLEGPVVDELDAVFATDWYCETGELLVSGDLDPESPGTRRGARVASRRGRAASPSSAGAAAGSTSTVGARPPVEGPRAQVLPSGPGFAESNNLKMFVGLVHAASRELAVVSPYFVPEDSLLLALTSAAERGVRVDLFVSEIGDQRLVHHAQRSYYEALLRSGVRIWLYPAPCVLHTKSVRVDDDVAVIGSSNLDVRSFTLNLEVSVLLHGDDAVAQLRRVEQEYQAASRELTLETWKHWPWPTKVVDNLARLASALV